MNIGPATFAPVRGLTEEEGIHPPPTALMMHGDFSTFATNQGYCSSDGWIGTACGQRGDGVIESVGIKYTMYLATGTP